VTADNRELLRRYVSCLILLALSLVLLPLAVLGVHALRVPLPALVANVLFFWPQFLLLPNGVLDTATHTPVFARASLYVAAAFWVVAVGAYVLGTRGMRRAWVLVGLLPAVLVVAQLVSIALGALGFEISLDGP
jgi:hypothetical protein